MIRALLAVLVVAVASAGCSTWQTRNATDPKIANESVVGKWRVTLKDGRRLEFAELTVRADTLRGFYHDTGGSAVLPMSGIAKIEQRRPNNVNTGLVVLGVVVVGIVIVGLATFEFPD